jgi:alpha-mannosidase
MDTQVEGIPLIVYNPLSIYRTDIVEASIIVATEPAGIRVLDSGNQDVLAQILNYDSQTGELSFIFQATIPSLGYASYELRLNESANLQSSLSVTNNSLENELYKVSLNNNGDVSSIMDKELNIDLLAGSHRLALLNDRSESWPAWEVRWEDVNSGSIRYVDENVSISIVENGPLRASLKVARSKNGSDFIQYIRLSDHKINPRIDFVNEVDWQSRGTMLKAVFPMRSTNPVATYDLSIGAIERGVNTSGLYEVAGHQWADQTHSNGIYGISILNDCKYGWDKPNNNTLRLTLIHTPAVNNNYIYQKDQDLGLNKFTYSIYRHKGTWDENTQWEASRLNQPLLAFLSPKHTGVLGRSFEFVSLNTNKVAVKALKKAEESDEIIIRIYELTGHAQNDVTITFPANIISAKEVNGIEENLGAISYTDNRLMFNINKFQPKTFAVKLANPLPAAATNNPNSTKVNISYNIDVMSYDSKKNDAASGIRYAYPAELLSDTILSDGIVFRLGNRNNGSRNALACNNQTITFPVNQGTKKVYILAASQNEKGSEAAFTIDGVTHTFTVPYYTGNAGSWETEYNLGGEYRRDNIAFTATHRHSVNDSKNDSYKFMYMYKYAIPVDEAASTLVLPHNTDILVFAVTLSNNTNDDIMAASVINSLPERSNALVTGECNRQLIPVTVASSHQNGSNEGPWKAVVGDPDTKWCVTNYNTPWLELTFGEDEEICRWFVMNAGKESFNSITSAFRLQKYEDAQWVDADVVENNTLNKVVRDVEPFTARRVRLQIDKGEQNAYTTRIPEFAVSGKSSGSTSIRTQETAGKNFRILGNYPNPAARTVTIQCLVPENIAELDLLLYDISGKLVDMNTYQFAYRDEIQEIKWNTQSFNGGTYLYRISAVNNGQRIYSNVNKMIIRKSGK